MKRVKMMRVPILLVALLLIARSGWAKAMALSKALSITAPKAFIQPLSPWEILTVLA